MTVPLPGDPPLTTSPPLSSLSILQHMTVPAERELYVLGSFEGRVTIYSQQIRALNLIHALCTTGALGEGKRLAVIGGGVAGITAAVGAACRGADVTLCERRPEILHLMRGCHTRWVHPSIYDWPRDNALSERTSLPFLNWRAASAGDVVVALSEQWDRLKSFLPIKEVTGVAMTLSPSAPGLWRVFTTSPGFTESEFHVVILATGFGVERTVAPLPLRSYWRDDSLHQPEIGTAVGPVHYLVSGSGDGGLIDVLRLRLREFQHGTLINELLTAADSESLRKQLLGIEDAACNLHARGDEHGEHLYRGYRDLRGVDELDERMRRRLRTDTRVTFNFHKWPFTIFSSILNRLLVSRLLIIDRQLETLIGHVATVDGVEPDLIVRATNGMNVRDVRCQRVVIRHGPISALQVEFPALYERMEPVLRARNALDQTRTPCWPEGFFSVPEVGSGPPPSVADVVPEGDEQAKIPAATTTPPVGDSIPHPRTSKESGVPITPAPPAAHSAAGAASEPADTPTGSGAAPARIRAEARKLRDQILCGQKNALSVKLAALNENERRFIVRSLALRALEESEDGFYGFGMLLQQSLLDPNSLDRAVLLQMLTEIAQKAAFSSSIAIKARVLEYPSELLRQIDQNIRRLFFEDVLDIVLRDQFAEVNTLVPPLVIAEMAIPESLYEHYFRTMLNQSRSGSHQGAPAAKRALHLMSEPVVKVVLNRLEFGSLDSYADYEMLQEFVKRHIALAEDDRRSILNDFITLDYLDFRTKYKTPD